MATPHVPRSEGSGMASMAVKKGLVWQWEETREKPILERMFQELKEAKAGRRTATRWVVHPETYQALLREDNSSFIWTFPSGHPTLGSEIASVFGVDVHVDAHISEDFLLYTKS